MSDARQQTVRRQADPVRVGADSPPASGTDTVTVACKIPNGVHMILYDHVDEVITDLGGNRVPSFRSFPRLGAPNYILNGCAVDIERMRKGQMPPHTIIQGDLSGTGFGLTSGIPRDFWIEWSTTVGKDLVDTGQVFAASDDRRAAAEAREKRNVRSGLEPLDPDNPGPRTGFSRGVIGRGTNPNSATE